MMFVFLIIMTLILLVFISSLYWWLTSTMLSIVCILSGKTIVSSSIMTSF